MRSLYLIGLSAIFIFLLTCLVYSPALKNGFVWDDVDYVTENTLIRSLDIDSSCKTLVSFHASNWHPLTWFSLAIDYAFWGLNPFGYHLTNIILHGLNTLLVFFLIIRLIVKTKEDNDGITSTSKMGGSIPVPSLIAAGVTALLFGLHPLHVESVAWVTERKDLLCAFFVILCILFYLSYTSAANKRCRWIWFASCLLLFVFALMSKPMAVTLPVILLLLDIYPLKRISIYPGKTGKQLAVLLEKIPFFTLSIASSVITIMAQHSGGAIRSLERFTADARLLNAVWSLVFYLEKIIFPFKLVPFYPFPVYIHWFDLKYIISGILVLAITSFCIWMVKKGNNLFFIAWLYYLITLLPVIGIIQVGSQAAADRYTYLPGLSIFLLVGIGVLWIFEGGVSIKHKGRLGVLVLIPVCIVMLLLGQLTVKQIKVWHDSESLWKYVISVFPERAPNAHINLGTVYMGKGMLDDAIYEHKKALAINPNLAKAHTNLGLAYVRKGMLDEAISEHRKALAISPDLAKIRNNLGSAYMKKGRLDEAIAEYKKALAINPNLAEIHNNLGNAYMRKRRLDEAIAEYKKALAINPDFAEIHNNLSVLYYSKGNYELAILHCDRAKKIKGSVNPKLLELLRPYR